MVEIVLVVDRLLVDFENDVTAGHPDVVGKGLRPSRLAR